MAHELNLDEYVFLINSIELASELAHERLVREWDADDTQFPIFIESKNETRYTEKAQDIFNHYYDYYLTIIESCKVKLEIKN
jgi:hypothetical protein